MNRIKWYGPSLLLIATIVGVMLLGPGVVRQIAWAQSEAKIQLIKDGLAKNAALAELSAAYRAVAEAVEPSVVFIKVSAKERPHPRVRPDDEFRHFFGPNFGPMMPPDEDQPNDQQQPGDSDAEKYNVPQAYGSGSGWVYDDKGHIITNNHVIEGADEIEITFHDGTKKMASVVGRDAKTDVAVLRVEGGDLLHPATIAIEPVEQGDIVCAFGSPFHFDFSMSQGIVSAKGRTLNILQQGQGYEEYIQTDAAINPGNSGGPLCNIQGQVVAMNAAIASQTGAFNGLGFAIPVDLVKDIADQIIKTGKVVRGYLAISIKNLDSDMAESYGFTGKGVLVLAAIPGGPAEKAGITADDIITKVNGRAVSTADELRFLVADVPPGKPVTIEVFRAGKLVSIDVTPEEMPAHLAMTTARPDEAPAAPAQQDVLILRKLGFEALDTFTPDIANQTNIKFQPGVLIKAVRPDSLAASIGLAPGQLVVGVMRTPVTTVAELVAELKKANLAKGVRLRIVAGDNTTVVLLKLPQED